MGAITTQRTSVEALEEQVAQLVQKNEALSAMQKRLDAKRRTDYQVTGVRGLDGGCLTIFNTLVGSRLSPQEFSQRRLYLIFEAFVTQAGYDPGSPHLKALLRESLPSADAEKDPAVRLQKAVAAMLSASHQLGDATSEAAAYRQVFREGAEMLRGHLAPALSAAGTKLINSASELEELRESLSSSTS